MKKSYILLALIFSFSLSLFSCKEKTGIKNEPQVSFNKGEPGDGQMDVRKLAEEELLRKSGLEGDISMVKELLDRNVNVNALDQDGRTALMFAAFNGHLEIVKSLYEKGAKINLQDYVGRTALMFASSGKFPETVNFLLEEGADANLVDTEENFTAIMFAASEGNMEVVKVLLKFKADPNLKDVDGETAEIFARTNGHIEVADYLKKISGN